MSVPGVRGTNGSPGRAWPLTEPVTRRGSCERCGRPQRGGSWSREGRRGQRYKLGSCRLHVLRNFWLLSLTVLVGAWLPVRRPEQLSSPCWRRAPGATLRPLFAVNGTRTLSASGGRCGTGGLARRGSQRLRPEGSVQAGRGHCLCHGDRVSQETRQTGGAGEPNTGNVAFPAVVGVSSEQEGAALEGSRLGRETERLAPCPWVARAPAELQNGP